MGLITGYTDLGTLTSDDRMLALDGGSTRLATPDAIASYVDARSRVSTIVATGVAATDTPALQSWIDGLESSGYNGRALGVFSVNSTLTIDDKVDADFSGSVLKAAAGLTGALLDIKKTGSTVNHWSNHVVDGRIHNLTLDGNGRSVSACGLRLAQIHGWEFSGTTLIYQFARQGLYLESSVRESVFGQTIVRGCGDLANGYAQVDLNHNTVLDAHNNLHFFGMFSIYPYGVGLSIVPTDDSWPVRNIFLHGLMLHGLGTTSGAQEYGYTYVPDWRHTGAPLLDIADAQGVFIAGARFQLAGRGHPHIRLRTNPTTVSTSTSGWLRDALFGSEVAHSAAFTADAGTDVITCSASKYSTGAMVRVSSSGTLPTGLSASTDYFVIRVDDNSFKLATTLANAEAGTAIDITATGSGTHTITAQGVGVLTLGGVSHFGISMLTESRQRAGVVNKQAAGVLSVGGWAEPGTSLYEALNVNDVSTAHPAAISVAGRTFLTSGAYIANNEGIYGDLAGSPGTYVKIADLSSGDIARFGNPTNSASIGTTQLSGRNVLQGLVNGSTRIYMNANGVAFNGITSPPTRTGWTAPSGTATKTTFNTATVTTAELAERVKALLDFLLARGDISA